MHENDCVASNDFFSRKFDTHHLTTILLAGVLNDIYTWVSVTLQALTNGNR